MITRHVASLLDERLAEAPAVALVGPRQVGKTTLARAVADARGDGALYLDLEQPQDRARLSDPAAYLALHADKLVILDEIHRAPEIFNVLRGQIDARRRAGRPFGHFLILGSAALPLLRQSSESLAGRIAFLEMTPLLPSEITADASNGIDEGLLPSPIRQLWLRGGFPSSYLATSDAASLRWRLGFIRSYLERDIPQFGIRVPAATLERFWTMLAHVHGGLLNAQQLAGSLGVAWHTASHYLNLMEDLLLIRRLIGPSHDGDRKRMGRVRSRAVVFPCFACAAYQAAAQNAAGGDPWGARLRVGLQRLVAVRARLADRCGRPRALRRDLGAGAMADVGPEHRDAVRGRAPRLQCGGP